MSAGNAVRRGFSRTLLFGALAAVGVPAAGVLLAPVLGLPLTLSLYVLGLPIAYLAWIAGSLRRGVLAGGLAAAGTLVLLLFLPGPTLAAVGAALTVAAVRSGFLFRAPQPRLLVLEAVLLVTGLAVADALAGPGLIGSALTVWGYFLVQSLYFLLARPRVRAARSAGDPFERARERLERLLDEIERGPA